MVEFLLGISAMTEAIEVTKKTVIPKTSRDTFSGWPPPRSRGEHEREPGQAEEPPLDTAAATGRKKGSTVR